MKLKHSLLVSFLAIILCVGFVDSSTYHTDEAIQITAEQFEEAYYKLLNGSLNVGGGDGSMIKWDEEKKIGYILTVYHVVAANYAAGTQIDVSWRYWWEPFGTMHITSGTIIAVDPDNDLALVTVNEKHEIFEVMSDEEYTKLKRGHPLMSSGYPLANINALMLGPGIVHDPAFDDDSNPLTRPVLYHGCVGWYGFSGAGVIDILTKKLVGAESRFGPNFHSSSSIAIPAPTINAFLKLAMSK